MGERARGSDPGAGRDGSSEKGGREDQGKVLSLNLHLTSARPRVSFYQLHRLCPARVPVDVRQKIDLLCEETARAKNICRRVVARKRIDRVIILSKVEGK